MAALAQRSWVTQLLRLMPAQLHKALDAWSYRVAQDRAQRRRMARQAPQVAPTDYKIRPWRD